MTYSLRNSSSRRNDHPSTALTPDSCATSSLALNRFPPEIQSIIVHRIAQLGKEYLAKMMVLSTDMHDLFSKILYKSLNFSSKNVNQIFEGIILGTPSMYSRPDNHPPPTQEYAMLDFATATQVRINSHIRKTKSLRLTENMVIEDYESVRRIVYFLQRISFPFDFPDTLPPKSISKNELFVKLQNLQITRNAIDQSVNTKEKISPIVHNVDLDNWETLRDKLCCSHICINPPYRKGRLGYSEVGDIIQELARNYGNSHSTVHNAWWNSDIEYHRYSTRLIFLRCSCRTCDPTKKTKRDKAVPSCPFTGDDIVDLISKICTDTRQSHSQFILSNVPKCTANIPWIRIEEKVRVNIEKSKTKPLEFRVERRLRQWKEIFESFKKEIDIEPCGCCGHI